MKRNFNSAVTLREKSSGRLLYSIPSLARIVYVSSYKKKPEPDRTKTSARAPLSLIEVASSIKIPTKVSQIISSIILSQNEPHSRSQFVGLDAHKTDMMVIDSIRITTTRYVFFLGVQGKEHIEDISSAIPSHNENDADTIFVSSNLLSVNGRHTSNNIQCSELTSYFKILDPLGGGSYPLDYLVIIDGNDQVRCKIPLVINNQNIFQRTLNARKDRSGISTHLTFGISLDQLAGFLEEYNQYFANHGS